MPRPVCFRVSFLLVVGVALLGVLAAAAEAATHRPAAAGGGKRLAADVTARGRLTVALRSGTRARVTLQVTGQGVRVRRAVNGVGLRTRTVRVRVPAQAAAAGIRVKARFVTGGRAPGLAVVTVTAAERPPVPGVPTETGVSTPPTLAPVGDRLRWAPPRLTAPTDVYVTNANRSLRLDAAKDYVVHMPATPLTASGGLVITGGRNVVLIGGEISIPWQGDTYGVNDRRGLYLKAQTGTIHVEGLLIDGEDLAEGVNLDERDGATVQIQNLRVVGVHARDEVNFTDNHPDVIQTWAGPDVLRVDRLTGSSDYQGFFLHPTQFGSVIPRGFDLSRVNLSGGPTAGYLLWQATQFPLTASDVWVQPPAGRSILGSLWPNVAAWPGVAAGAPPSGDFVPAGVAGVGYRSPGYVPSA